MPITSFKQYRFNFVIVMLHFISLFSPCLGLAKTKPTPAKISSILSDESLGGVDSFYTKKLNNLIKETRTAPRSPLTENIRLECLGLKTNPYYIGARQEMLIRAPIKTVADIMDNINGYKELFPGYKDIHIVSRDQDKILTFWEQNVPIPFVPNVKYEMIYKFDWLNTSEKLYRYQLKRPDTLIMSDGFIYLKDLSNNETLYVEYDFFDAKWGGAKTFGARKIWYDTVEGLALSDLATKVKAEHPEFTNEKSQREGRKILKSDLIVNCIKPVI